jgi:hypothetical protein
VFQAGIEENRLAFSIDPATLIGLSTLVAAIASAIISVITAVKQNTTQQGLARVEVHTNSMSERLQDVAHAKGVAEEQLRTAAAIITQAASNGPAPKPPVVIMPSKSLDTTK